MILSACGADANASTTPEAESTQAEVKSTPKVESTNEAATRIKVNTEALKGLRVSVWTPWYGVEESLFETFVKEFNETNQWGIQVTAQTQINFTNLYETVNAALPTADKPDMVIALPEHAQGWYADGVSVDLKDYVEDPVYGIDELDFPYAFWNQDFAGTARVAMPAQRTTTLLLWNQTWAEELGIDTPPLSPDDFRSQSCRAHDSMRTDAKVENDGMGGWLVNTDETTAYSWLLAFGGGALEENNYRFLTQKNIDAFTFLRKLSESNCAWVSADDPVTQFANRDALFITATLKDLPNVTRAFSSAENRDEWKALPFPNNDNGVIAVYGSSYVILKSTDEKQFAAWLFIRWLLEKEQDARWVEATHLFPLRTSTLSLLGDYEKTHPQWKQAVDMIPQGEMQPQLASWRTVKVMLGDGFTHMYRVGVSSGQVAAILAQMESLAQELSK